MGVTVLHSAPRFTAEDGLFAALQASLGDMLLAGREEFGEIVLTVRRDAIESALRLLRDQHDYQQLMEIAGVDYPDRAERFEVVYMLLSVTCNHRLLVKVNAAENTPVPTVTTLWPVAGWLEREVFDMYGVIFAGNVDLRRILTDYGFEGHPFRKDFPLTGHVELRYSEEDKRVVYEPVRLAQDLRSFDFMSPWEGADYVLPGDEKAVTPPAPPPPPAAPPPAPAPAAKAEAAPAAAVEPAAKPARKPRAKKADAPAEVAEKPKRKRTTKKADGGEA